MLYVIYSPLAKQYLNDAGGLGSFAEANQYDSINDANWDLADDNTALKIVGPCRLGEEP